MTDNYTVLRKRDDTVGKEEDIQESTGDVDIHQKSSFEFILSGARKKKGGI